MPATYLKQLLSFSKMLMRISSTKMITNILFKQSLQPTPYPPRGEMRPSASTGHCPQTLRWLRRTKLSAASCRDAVLHFDRLELLRPILQWRPQLCWNGICLGEAPGFLDLRKDLLLITVVPSSLRSFSKRLQILKIWAVRDYALRVPHGNVPSRNSGVGAPALF